MSPLRIETLSPPQLASTDAYELWATLFNTSPRGRLRPASGANLQDYDQTVVAQHVVRRTLAYVNDRCIGCGVVRHMSEIYDEDRYQMDITVHPDHQRQGHGAALFDHAMAILTPRQPRELVAILDGDDHGSIKFANTRGFTQHEMHVSSRLTLDADRLAQGDGLPEGYRVITLAALRQASPPAWERRLWRLTSAIEHDLPSQFPVTPMDFDTFKAAILDHAALCQHTTMIALMDEEMVGLSSIWVMPDRPTGRNTGLTGVARAHRRRGLAMGLKRAVMRRCHELGVTTIITENEASNPMLHINKALGFAPVSTTLVMRRNMARAAHACSG